MDRVHLVVASAIVAFAFADTLSGCDDSQPHESTVETQLSLEEQLLKIADEYRSNAMVNEDLAWAPYYCRPPFPKLVFSSSDDATTHGRKLYHLFVADRDAYRLTNVKASGSPVGQAIVKESWTAEKVEHKGSAPATHNSGEVVVASTSDGDTTYKQGEKHALFIMFKLAPDTPGTDNGWVYGTVTADGKQVTSVGRVETCMKCHTESPHDRLLGLELTSRED